MDWSNWKSVQVKITVLQLDPLNPRVPGLATQRSTRDIVAALIQNEDVYPLAKSIVEFGGLYPTERLIAIDEKGQRIVVEGNRRLAALKLLHSPELAPDKLVEKFRTLSSKIDRHHIEKAEVVLAPTRATAAQVIVPRHTGESIRRWSPGQQARYIRTLVTPEYTIEEVAHDIHLNPGEIREFLRTDTMLQLARAMPLEESVLRALDDKDRFSVTTLERLTRSAEGQAFLGITFDPDCNAIGGFDSEEFKTAYSRIVSDIAAGKIDTRKVNSKTDIRKYLDSIKNVKPNKKQKRKWTSATLLSHKPLAAEPPKAQADRKTKAAQREHPFLVPRSFQCRLQSPRIKEILGELRRLKVVDYPNACGVLVRILVELVIGDYLDRTGKIQPLLDKAKKDGKGNDWAPTLRQMMRLLLDDPDLNLKPLPLKALKKMANDNDHPLSLDHLDQFVHNRYMAPSERQLRLIWSAFEPLLERLTDEPITSKTSGAKKPAR